MITALYPGSFDPVTNGHLDIAKRASTLFDRLVMGVYERPLKQLLFTVSERVDMLRRSVTNIPNIQIEPYGNLTADFAKEINAQVIVRGLRMSSDFEREFEMALMNKKLYPDLELVCLMANLQYQFVTSSLIKEVVQLGGCIEGLVPTHVAEALMKKLRPDQKIITKERRC